MTKTKFYIATGLGNMQQHNEVRDVLVAEGHEITYDWTVHGPVWQEDLTRCGEVAQLELAGVAAADVVVVLLPGGRGTHVELGVAAALDIPIILWAPRDNGAVLFEAVPETCAFYHLPNVRKVASVHPTGAVLDVLIDILAEING